MSEIEALWQAYLTEFDWETKCRELNSFLRVYEVPDVFIDIEQLPAYEALAGLNVDPGNSQCYSDGIHPTAEGYDILSTAARVDLLAAFSSFNGS